MIHNLYDFYGINVNTPKKSTNHIWVVLVFLLVLRTISNLVMGYRNPDGIHNDRNGGLTINLKGVQEIIEIVAWRLGVYKEPPSLEELQTKVSSWTFNLSEVQKYVAIYLGHRVLPRGKAALVALLFNMYGKPPGVNFEELKELLTQIQTSNIRLVAEFPYRHDPKTAIPYKLERSVYKFSLEEVEFIVADYLFS